MKMPVAIGARRHMIMAGVVSLVAISVMGVTTIATAVVITTVATVAMAVARNNPTALLVSFLTVAHRTSRRLLLRHEEGYDLLDLFRRQADVLHGGGHQLRWVVAGPAVLDAGRVGGGAGD